MAALDRLFKHWPIAAFVISAGMLAVAHSFQTFGHLAPCHLCLKQREALPVALGAGGAGRFPRPKGHRIASLLAACLPMAYLAAFHAGASGSGARARLRRHRRGQPG